MGLDNGRAIYFLGCGVPECYRFLLRLPRDERQSGASVSTSHGAIFSLLRRGSLSAGTHSRCATETMVVRSDSNISQISQGFNVKDSLSASMDAIDTDGITKLLVEIAIVDTSVVGDADELATHEFRDGLCIEVCD